MSIRSKVLAAAAAVTLIAGVGTAGVLSAGPASAGTPSCGHGCLNVWNQDIGPEFTVDVFRQGSKTGQPVILFRATNFDPAEDFSVSFQGSVADFYAAGLVSATTALHYGCDGIDFTGGSCAITGGVFPNLPAFEVEYAPYGVDSGLCTGVATTAYSGEGVTLQPCGVSSKTVWILDTLDNQSVPDSVPLINGSNTNFSHPFVLTYPASAFPTDKPRVQIEVTNLTGFTQPGSIVPVISTVSSAQLWTGAFGITDVDWTP
jgi:hypothetical protein